jgi:3-hydroxyisobutyrate dehydrogenase-like beta-hydroxyacid dehydrogenase
LANKAHIKDVSTYQRLVTEADIILSILVPARAKQAAQVVAQAIAETKAEMLYADCNAIAPATTEEIREIITMAGGRFIDASIIGPPPRNESVTHFYASGPDAGFLEELNRFGLNLTVLGEQIGQASAIKMCYAALTKGVTAVGTELLTAAEILGVSGPLKQEFQLSQPALYGYLERQLPRMPMRSLRWIGEMREIAKTFHHAGLTPKIFAGAADVYHFVSKTKLAERKPEDPSPIQDLGQMLPILADRLYELR